MDYSGSPYTLVDQAWILMLDSVSATSTVEAIISAAFSTLSSSVMSQIDGYYTDVINAYDKAVQKGTDAWFSGGIKLVMDTLVAQSSRVPGTVYTFLFAQEVAASVAGNKLEHLSRSGRSRYFQTFLNVLNGLS